MKMIELRFDDDTDNDLLDDHFDDNSYAWIRADLSVGTQERRSELSKGLVSRARAW